MRRRFQRRTPVINDGQCRPRRILPAERPIRVKEVYEASKPKRPDSCCGTKVMARHPRGAPLDHVQYIAAGSLIFRSTDDPLITSWPASIRNPSLHETRLMVSYSGWLLPRHAPGNNRRAYLEGATLHNPRMSKSRLTCASIRTAVA